ncbi:hypothetical protein ABZP36_005295 [Zizania latifolia]
MYAKCGEVQLGLEVFKRMKEKNVMAWTSMIKGLVMHGRGSEALTLFSQMENLGVKPDDIVYFGALIQHNSELQDRVPDLCECKDNFTVQTTAQRSSHQIFLGNDSEAEGKGKMTRRSHIPWPCAALWMMPSGRIASSQ